ncbi:MAG: DUF7882 family protein [Candidatus Microbacterium stercoravium]
MGVLRYNDGQEIEMNDLLLAHLKLVVITKLRRQESFTLSWAHREAEPGGRSTVWMHPAIPLHFVFDSPEPTQLSPAWLEKMAATSHSTGGIVIDVDQTEPPED